jgi:hypothetical protein
VPFVCGGVLVFFQGRAIRGTSVWQEANTESAGALLFHLPMLGYVEALVVTPARLVALDTKCMPAVVVRLERVGAHWVCFILGTLSGLVYALLWQLKQ